MFRVNVPYGLTCCHLSGDRANDFILYGKGGEFASQASTRTSPRTGLRASVATILLDAGMPLDQVQKFLRHKRITTTQIYAETSLHGMGENYVRAVGSKQ